jgi:PAS domain S-box-containing protein
MAEHYAPLVSIAKGIKIEATIAHLWFEEIISGDTTINIDDVWKNLDQADKYARIMLEGGETLEGTISPLDDLESRHKIEQVLLGLQAFRDVARVRWQEKTKAAIGSDIDQRFDKIFNIFLNQSDDVITILQEIITNKLLQFQILQSLLITVITMLGMFIAIILQRNERRHLLDILAVKSREQNLAVTLNSIGDGVITTDATGNVTRINPVAEELTGWNETEAQGQPIKTVFPIINAINREPVANPVEKVLATGEMVYLSNHTTLISKDGTEYQIMDSAAPIRNEANDILGMILVFNDDTEKYQLREAMRKSEKRLAEAQRMVHIGNWELNLLTNKFVCSDEIFRIFEIDKELFEASYDVFLNVIHPEDREKVNKAYIKSLEDKLPCSIDHRLLMPDGRIKHVNEHYKTVFDDAGAPLYSTGTVQDISEQINMEETLRRTQKMDALGKLTGGIAHDFNNMLGVVLGYSDLLQGALDKQPKLANYAHEIHHAGKRGARLTNKLLAFSRKNISEAACVNLNSVLLNSQNMLEKTLTVRIKLMLELAEDLWTIWTNDSDMEDIILNMSINAMHAMEGNGQLNIRTSNKQFNQSDAEALALTAGDYVLLSISDTGCGMDEATKNKIFEPFFSTKGEEGTGLGLSQAYGFVHGSGGQINVYSEQGYGTKFDIYFPRYCKNESKETSVEKNTLVKIKGRKTILVVDDEAALLSLNSEILVRHGFNVFSAGSAKQALDILEHEMVDILISDIIMPEMDGYQLAAIVKEKYPKIKIQLASGFTSGDNADAVDEGLKKNLLSKPFNSKSLLNRIQQLLNEVEK